MESKMRNFINKIGNVVTKFISDTIDGDLLIYEIPLSGNSVLKVYVYGKYNSKFRFVYKDKRCTRTKKIDRVLRDRMPMAELRTGIHDKQLSDFTGKNVRFFR